MPSPTKTVQFGYRGLDSLQLILDLVKGGSMNGYSMKLQDDGPEGLTVEQTAAV